MASASWEIPRTSYFPTELTAETFTSPDTMHNGSGFATFLLGALDGQSQMIGGPAPDPHIRVLGHVHPGRLEGESLADDQHRLAQRI